MIDFAVPMDHTLKMKRSEKSNKYLDLLTELKNQCNILVTVIPVVVVTLGVVSKDLGELRNCKSEVESRP